MVEHPNPPPLHKEFFGYATVSILYTYRNDNSQMQFRQVSADSYTLPNDKKPNGHPLHPQNKEVQLRYVILPKDTT